LKQQGPEDSPTVIRAFLIPASLESVTILDMGAQTFEGVVEHGQIRLNSEVHIPEGAKVYVLVPGMEAEPGPIHLRSPRLARPEQAVDFEMEVVQP
jgi:hypothetical protein